VADERKTILVVEDSPMMSRMYRLVLGPRYDLVFAANGAEGLDRAAAHPRLDLLVVDINMPQMDGLEFIGRLRRELGITTPVLVSSTETSDADRQAARDAGAQAFLAKPWTPDQLLAAVRERLEAG
jgi:two-component system chemotaxis response regulator CheY